MGKRFFYVCAGVLFVSLGSAHLHAQTVSLYAASGVPGSSNFTLGTYGAFNAPVSPSSLLFGVMPIPGAAQAVVVEQHVLRPGDLVPLPRYADGSEANESEIFWTPHLWQAQFTLNRQTHYWPDRGCCGGDRITISFDGRRYNGGYGLLEPLTSPLQETIDIEVLVTVVAVRTGVPVEVSRFEIGQNQSPDEVRNR